MQTTINTKLYETIFSIFSIYDGQPSEIVQLETLK